MEKNATVAAVFMTDGEDTSSKNLPETIQKFTNFVQKCGRQVVIHTLGFGRSHSKEFLDKLRAMGTMEGMYR